MPTERAKASSNGLLILVIVIFALIMGGLIGRATVSSSNSTDMKSGKQSFLKSLGFDFVDKSVGQLQDGEAGWATPWSIDGTPSKAFAAKDLDLEKDGPFGTVHLLVGKKDGRYTATLFSPPASCGGSDDSPPSGEVPLGASVVVDYVKKPGPCPYGNMRRERTFR